MTLGKLVVFFLLAMLLAGCPEQAHAETSIENVTAVSPSSVERYARFEVAFGLAGSTYTNPYFPYDSTPIPGLAPGMGVSVDALFLPPSATNWSDAKRVGCFYFQPYDEVTLTPQGLTQWRCRFTPEVVGTWQYKIQVVDKNGATESVVYGFTCTDSSRKGFIRVSKTDSRFFEFSDGTPFVSTLVTLDPLRSGADINSTMAKLGQNGIRFVRWFPNTENGTINLFGDAILSSWRFGASGYSAADSDLARGSTWSYSPYYYAAQGVYLQSGEKYRLFFRANVTGEQVLEAGIGTNPSIVVCSPDNALHRGCTVRKSGWDGYEMVFTADATGYSELYIHGLYVSTDAPDPYNEVRSGKVLINEVTLQRDESGSGNWGANMVSRGDADTHLYVDQNQAALMDEVLKYSDLYGVYLKLTIFHKNDGILNYYDQNGNLADWYQCDWGYCPNHFYSGDGQMVRWLQKAYMRYFLARWSYSPAIHSLEYVNESDFYDAALQAGWMYAKYVAENSSRRILTTNSFWGYWVGSFFKDPTYEQYLDYSDVHWYANQDAHEDDPISTIWDDTVANVRQCYLRFKEYAAGNGGYTKPFVRGETGVAVSGTQPQDPAIAAEVTGTYYHKKVWAHVGLLGYTCDGEWYPRIFEAPADTAFPNTTYDIYKIYAAYDKFVANEPLNNGTHVDLGIDLAGDSRLLSSNADLRAYGSRDAATSRALVWVDNKNNTWLNPNHSAAASGTISIMGMPAGQYTQETWDTRTGTYTKVPGAVTVGEDDILEFNVSTSKDVAFKFYMANSTPTAASLYFPSILMQ